MVISMINTWNRFGVAFGAKAGSMDKALGSSNYRGKYCIHTDWQRRVHGSEGSDLQLEIRHWFQEKRAYFYFPNI